MPLWQIHKGNGFAETKFRGRGARETAVGVQFAEKLDFSNFLVRFGAGTWAGVQSGTGCGHSDSSLQSTCPARSSRLSEQRGMHHSLPAAFELGCSEEKPVFYPMLSESGRPVS